MEDIFLNTKIEILITFYLSNIELGFNFFKHISF